MPLSSKMLFGLCNLSTVYICKISEVRVVGLTTIQLMKCDLYKVSHFKTKISFHEVS